MRIIAGKYGGRQIKTVESKNMRPTTDRVREAMFSSLISIYGNINNCTVLDAYAGSGALGIEAISRGAASCTSFEIDKKTYNNLLENYKTLGITDQNLYCLDITKVNFSNLCTNKSFDLLFFDPPYKNDVEQLLFVLNKLVDSACVADDAVLIFEHTIKNDLKNYISRFENIGFIYNKEKVYGDIVLSFFKFIRSKNE